MAHSILRLDLGMVNAYLIQGKAGFVLIDTGYVSHRSRVDATLRDAGCDAGDLRLILLTHGDPDHTANAAYLRDRYGARIAMHRAEAASVKEGNMFLSRGSLPLLRRLMKPAMRLFRLRKRDRFTPDIFLDDGDRLDEYGLDATVLHVPGHSRGSIAVLTADGDLFSGDFLENRRRPALATLVDDAEALRAGFDRVVRLEIGTVYPGHGAPFPLDAIRLA